jgi:uncharacterized protein YjbJ (UPF0337 family)
MLKGKLEEARGRLWILEGKLREDGALKFKGKMQQTKGRIRQNIARTRRRVRL